MGTSRRRGSPPAGGAPPRSEQDPSSARRPSFSVLYRQHFRRVVRWVRLWGVPARTTEDVTQDIFLNVHASLDRYDPSRPFETWLRSITDHTVIDFLRSAQHRREQPAHREDDVSPIDTRPSPEHDAAVAEAQRILVEVLGELSDAHRQVFVMHVLDDMTIPDIAAALGLNENTVRSRLARARADFAAIIERRRAPKRALGLLVPALLVDAGRRPFDVDPAMRARIWGRLVRILGLGIIGALAPLPVAQILAGAALLTAMGGVGGAALMRVAMVDREAEPLVRAEAPGIGAPRPPAPPAPSIMSTTASVEPKVARPERDAGAHDPASTLRVSQAILDRAREDIAGEKWQAALRELANHERQFPNGPLVDQRRELRRQVMEELHARDGGAR